jgi:hypothetical protein
MNESKIIPVDLQDQLLALRDDITRTSWAIGDLATEVIRYNALNNTGATMHEIFKAVGSIVGRESRTIREYQTVSSRFPFDVRDKFDVLAYGHFRVVTTQDNPEDALQWAVDQVDKTGKPATIDAMLMKYRSKKSETVDEKSPIDEMLTFGGYIRDYVDEIKERVPAGLVERIWKQTEELDKSIREVALMLEQSYN